MLDAVKESLADIRKELEKKLIQTFVASQSHTTSENRKQMMNQMEKEKMNGLKVQVPVIYPVLKQQQKGNGLNKRNKHLNKLLSNLMIYKIIIF